MVEKTEIEYSKMTCLIPKKLHKQLKQLAVGYDTSITKIVEGLIEKYIREEKEHIKKNRVF